MRDKVILVKASLTLLKLKVTIIERFEYPCEPKDIELFIGSKRIEEATPNQELFEMGIGDVCELEIKMKEQSQQHLTENGVNNLLAIEPKRLPSCDTSECSYDMTETFIMYFKYSSQQLWISAKTTQTLGELKEAIGKQLQVDPKQILFKEQHLNTKLNETLANLKLVHKSVLLLQKTDSFEENTIESRVIPLLLHKVGSSNTASTIRISIPSSCLTDGSSFSFTAETTVSEMKYDILKKLNLLDKSDTIRWRRQAHVLTDAESSLMLEQLKFKFDETILLEKMKISTEKENTEHEQIEHFHPCAKNNVTDVTDFDDNKTHGRRGMDNFGNSCYINSALQCLSNVPELTKFFIEQLSQNSDMNPFQEYGNVTSSYAEFIHDMWINEKNGRAVTPSRINQT
ncbi:unnamed protein product, partial [Didymodactylos carnosus]